MQNSFWPSLPPPILFLQKRALHHLTEILPVFKQLGRHDFQPKYLVWQAAAVLIDAFITTSFHLKFRYKSRVPPPSSKEGEKDRGEGKYGKGKTTEITLAQ